MILFNLDRETIFNTVDLTSLLAFRFHFELSICRRERATTKRKRPSKFYRIQVNTRFTTFFFVFAFRTSSPQHGPTFEITAQNDRPEHLFLFSFCISAGLFSWFWEERSRKEQRILMLVWLR